MKGKVLVTGATGFLGSNLVKALLKENYQVIILKRSFSNTWRIEEILSQLTVYDVDSCDLEQPFREAEKIAAVIHTATNYGRNQDSVSKIFDSNVSFPLHLLDIAASYGTEIFLNTDTMLDPNLNSYALSKHQFREWGKQFGDREKICFVNIQLEHMYGPGDDNSKFTTYAIESCLNNVPELALTSGVQKRDFIYIDDVVAAYCLLLEKVGGRSQFYQNYELGSAQAISIRELVETIHQIAHSQTRLNFGAIPLREHETMYSQADIQQLEALGWSPQYTLEQGLHLTISSHKINDR